MIIRTENIEDYSDQGPTEMKLKPIVKRVEENCGLR